MNKSMIFSRTVSEISFSVFSNALKWSKVIGLGSLYKIFIISLVDFIGFIYISKTKFVLLFHYTL